MIGSTSRLLRTAGPPRVRSSAACALPSYLLPLFARITIRTFFGKVGDTSGAHGADRYDPSGGMKIAKGILLGVTLKENRVMALGFCDETIDADDGKMDDDFKIHKTS